VINPYRCTECVGSFESPKCAEICPGDACVLNPDYNGNPEQLLEKWHNLHPGETHTYVT